MFDEPQEGSPVHEIPPLGWFGGMMIARHLLSWSKGSEEDETFTNAESFVAKMNRPNWIVRVQLILFALNAVGPSIEAANFIQKCQFFTDVSPEALAEELKKAVATLGNGGIFKFRSGEFGSLDFSNPMGTLPPIPEVE